MIKKAFAIFGAYLIVCLLVIISMGKLGEATTATYQFTMRLVNASGFVVGGTASATTASYNMTCQVVDQNGTVLNPGTASGTSASPNCTIRVVDASGFVQSAIGASASPTASPSPSFIVGVKFAAAGANPTVTIPSGGATPVVAGDCAQFVVTSQASATNVLNSGTNSSGFAPLVFSSTQWSSGNFVNNYTKYVTPQDIATGFYTLTGNVGTNNAVCVGFFRHVSCSATDGISTTGATASTSVAYNAATSTINGDINITEAVSNPTAGVEVYTPSTGYTNDVFLSGVNATSFGCAIDHKVQSTAGATTPASGTWTNISANGTFNYFLQNIGGTQ